MRIFDWLWWLYYRIPRHIRTWMGFKLWLPCFWALLRGRSVIYSANFFNEIWLPNDFDITIRETMIWDIHEAVGWHVTSRDNERLFLGR